MPHNPPANCLAPPPQRRPLLREILRAVEAETGVGIKDLTSKSRRRHIVRARWLYFWCSRHVTGRSLPAIGRACGGRDHSTVLNGIRRINADPAAFEPGLSHVLARLMEARQ